MKTQIIHLEPHDDVAYTSDQIGRAGCEEILLVWPQPPSVLRSKLDLALLARQARRHGMRLGLVTRQPEIMLYAAQIGIPAFRTVRLARQLPWEPGGEPMKQARSRPQLRRRGWRETRASLPRSSPPQQPAAVRVLLLVLSLFAFLALASVAVPRARIILHPATQAQTLELEVSADLEVATPNLAGILPAREVEIIVEGRRTIPASGRLSLPLAAAGGTVVLTNLTGEPLTVPAGTSLRTVDGPLLRFLTLEEAELPGEAGAQVEMEVTAEVPGPAGNLPALSALAVEGDLGLKVSAANLLPFSGGQEQASAAPAPEDYDRLRAALLETLWQSALEEATRGPAAPGMVLSTAPGAYRLVTEQFEPEQPQPASELNLRLQVAFVIQFVPREALDAFAQAVMDASLPEGFESVPGTFSASVLDIPVRQEDGTYRLRLLLARTLRAGADVDAIAVVSAGKPPARASAALLETLPLQPPPEIVISPAWWPLLPWLPAQIVVEP